jgi:hypothetical protein
MARPDRRSAGLAVVGAMAVFLGFASLHHKVRHAEASAEEASSQAQEAASSASEASDKAEDASDKAESAAADAADASSAAEERHRPRTRPLRPMFLVQERMNWTPKAGPKILTRPSRGVSHRRICT